MGNKFHDQGCHENDQWIAFHCPGCKGGHGIPVTGNRAWQWNGSFDKPTIRPSILVNVNGSNPTQPICHSHITDGKISFCPDSTHKLTGQTVDIPDWD